MYASSSSQSLLNRVVEATESIRLKRRQQYATHPHPAGKRFSQEELAELAYPSYKNLINRRTNRIPDRAALLQIADYLECSLEERNLLLEAAQYALEKPLAEPQRKQVTVLFARLAQLDQLAGALDVEDLYHLMIAFWNSLYQIVLEYGGRVETQGGDTFMAIWGAEHTRENDGERAVRAALTMQRTLPMLNEEHQTHLMLRVGINTGLALIGSFREDETASALSAVGADVNIARTLGDVAPPDGTYIAYNTYRLVRDLFETHREKATEAALQHALNHPQNTRGRVPQVYSVGGFKPRSFRLSSRGVEVDTPLVGRMGELERLRGAFREMVDTGSLHIITIVGEVGVGKSRLLYEFDDWIDLIPQRVYYFKGRAIPTTQGVVNGLLRDLIALRFEIMDSDMASVVRQKLEHNLADALGDTVETRIKAHLLGAYLGFDFGESEAGRAAQGDLQGGHKRALYVLQEYFATLSDIQPVVLLLEDIHWADESSLRALQQIWMALADHALLLVCTARPTLLERYPSWNSQAYHQRLNLLPLNEAHSRALLESLLPNGDVVWNQLLPLTVDRAEGNPFYLGELVRWLIDESVIIADGDAWAISSAVQFPPPLPATLTHVLQTRFDNLPTSEKHILQSASVIGRVFWDDAVVALQRDHPVSLRQVQQQVVMALAELQKRELISRRERSSFEGFEEYLFHHALLRDSVYESVLKPKRRAHHRLAGQWLIAMSEARHRADEYAALIADHFERADLPPMAAQWYARAGKYAAMRYLNEEAVRLLTRALDLLPDGAETDAARGSWLVEQVKVLERIGDKVARLAALNALLALLDHHADLALHARTLLLWAQYHSDMGNHAEAQRTALLAIGDAREGNLLEIEVEACLIQATSVFFMGNPQFSRDLCLQALRLARQLGNRTLQAQVLTELCRYEKTLNHLTAAEGYIKAAQSIFHHLRDQIGEGRTFAERGELAYLQGKAEVAEKALLHALELQRTAGDAEGLIKTLNSLGNIASDGLDYLKARRYIEQSYRLALETGQENGALAAYLNVAFVAWPVGEMAFALERLQDGLLKAEQANNPRMIAYALHGIGKVLREQGQPHVAADYALQAAERARLLQFVYLEAFALAELGYCQLQLLRYEQTWETWVQVRALCDPSDPDDVFNAEVHLTWLASLRHDPAAFAHYGDQVRAYARQHEIAKIRSHVELYSAAYRVFRLLDDPLAFEFLRVGYSQIEKVARMLPDEAARARMVAGVLTYRRIVELWAAAGQPASPYLPMPAEIG